MLVLAASVNLRSKLKFALLTALIAISTLVFLGVAELSRASELNLTEAIESDLGVAGTYRVQPSGELGLSRADLLAAVGEVSSQFSERPIQVAVKFPSVRPECPPFTGIGEVTAAVMLGPTGAPVPFAGGGLGAAADLCLAGLVIPKSALRESTDYEQASFDTSVVLDPLYERLLYLANPQRPMYTIVITTGRSEDRSAEIRNSMADAFADAAARAAVDVTEAVVVTRADSGDSVRSASDGIRLVYGLIGWGVLVVGGIGVLVAELIVLRDRTWFFGLARAVGARRWSVAWLVLADILIVLASGLATAAAALVLSAPWVDSFGQTAFQVDLQILRLSAVPGLLAGMAFVLVLGGAYPAWRATRLDPVDVLERR